MRVGASEGRVDSRGPLGNINGAPAAGAEGGTSLQTAQATATLALPEATSFCSFKVPALLQQRQGTEKLSPWCPADAWLRHAWGLRAEGVWGRELLPGLAPQCPDPLPPPLSPQACPAPGCWGCVACCTPRQPLTTALLPLPCPSPRHGGSRAPRASQIYFRTSESSLSATSRVSGISAPFHAGSPETGLQAW